MIFCLFSIICLSFSMNNKTIIEFGFRVIWRISKASACVIHLSFASADNTNLGLDNSSYHTQPHSIIVNYFRIFEGEISLVNLSKCFLANRDNFSPFEQALNQVPNYLMKMSITHCVSSLRPFSIAAVLTARAERT